jgi:signal transduction histidine kinase/CheY-like chemotaxis protein
MNIPKPLATPAARSRSKKSASRGASNTSQGTSQSASRSLRAKLDEAEQTLAAIRAGEVDALVVVGSAGERVFTLEGAEHTYRVLMEAMSEGVATLTEYGLISYCNARFAAIVGARLEWTIGSPMSRLVPASDWKRFQALIAAGTRDRSEGEFWLKAPSAEASVLVRLAVVTLTIAGTRTHCLVMTDLTEQRRQDAAIAAERAQMQTRLLLADRMSSLGTLAAGVAHEINNPLAYVVASLELMNSRLPEPSSPTPMLDAESTEWLRRQLARAREGAERVRLIVRGLKAFSRADDETMGVVDPRRALDTSLALLANEIRHRAQLVKDYDTLPLVWANEARLGQVFLNLIVNATQAIPVGIVAHNEIRVSGHTDQEGRAVIEIGDTGSGIEAEHLALIFDPFFTTKPLNVGTGLGLALCHAIVSSLDGQITVKSAPGAGSVFRVVLPGVEGALPAPASSSVVASKIEPRGRLLVIDDEQNICELMQEALAPHHDVVTATTAHQALELLAAGHRFDLILCDIRMPAMTGIDFHSRLGTTDPAQASHVVLMSGGFTRRPGDPPIVLPRPFLEKPFKIEQVLALMREAMQREPLVA